MYLLALSTVYYIQCLMLINTFIHMLLSQLTISQTKKIPIVDNYMMFKMVICIWVFLSYFQIRSTLLYCFQWELQKTKTCKYFQCQWFVLSDNISSGNIEFPSIWRYDKIRKRAAELLYIMDSGWDCSVIRRNISSSYTYTWANINIERFNF